MLLKELLKLNESKFILALTYRDKIEGYYVADDEDVTDDPKQAFSYPSKSSAEAEAKLNNEQWDLEPGYKFVVKQVEE